GAPTTVASTTSTLTYNETTHKMTGTFFITSIPVGSNYVVAAHVTENSNHAGRAAAEGDVEGPALTLHIGGLVDTIQDGVTSDVTLNFESHIKTLALMYYAKSQSAALSNTSVITNEVKAAIASSIDEMFAEVPPEELMMMMYFLMMEEFVGGDPYDPPNWSGEFQQFLAGIVAQAGLDTHPSGPGFVSGRIYDAVTSEPVADGQIYINGESAYSDQEGYFSAQPGSGEHFYTISKDGYITAEARIVANSQSGASAGTIFIVPSSYSGNGSVCGTVVNALDNSYMPDTNVSFIAGHNYLTGNSVAYDVTDEYGAYCLEGVPAGNYTAVFSGEGIITSRIGVAVVGGETVSDFNQSVAPVFLGEGDYRFVLTWGSYPSDLDSHIHIPLNGGESYYHVYHGDEGNAESEPMTILDLDDTDSYGPETITIVQQYSEGTYVYYVYNYSDSEDSSTSLLTSGARVDVYSGDSLLTSFNVPASGVGPIWMVCTLDDDVLTPINQIGTYEDFSDLIPDDGYFEGEGEPRIIAKKSK
ncbi:MAG TPA: hypothetical protein PLK80_13935, partial [bacterium]|nr:hypothetical protein [bacterium]